MACCLFGIFVFGTNSSVIYRFLANDLYTHLKESYKSRGYETKDDQTNHKQNIEHKENEIEYTFDDALSQHLCVLLRIHEQTQARHDPIRRVRLETGMQIFFDQIGDNHLLCMADESFHPLIVLKTINLFKALIKFHIGALPFIYYNIADQLIDRISAALEYYLKEVTINQPLLFESYEYLQVNQMIWQKCENVSMMISNEIQKSIKASRKIILITSNEKMVHMYSSNKQVKIDPASICLLILNNSSRSLRKNFSSQINSTNVTAHRFDIKQNNAEHLKQKRSNSFSLSSSLNPSTSSEKLEIIHRNEIVFLKTTNKLIQPYTLFTIPLTDQISVLILIEWEKSDICSNLYELIKSLDTCINHGLFPYKKLSPQVALIENNGSVQQYFERIKYSPNILTESLNQAYNLHRASAKPNCKKDDQHRNGLRILGHLTRINCLMAETFRDLFFDSIFNAQRSGLDMSKDRKIYIQMDGIDQSDSKKRKNEYDTSEITKPLRKMILQYMEDLFSFIEVKSQRNITMNFCHSEFPGLVHFTYIDRSRGRIYSPTLIDHYQYQLLTNDSVQHNYHKLEQKIMAFQIECLSALQQGFTAYNMSDDHFTFNYTLRLFEENGEPMRLYEIVTQTQPPGIFYFDFYKVLSEKHYPWLTRQSSVKCLELITVHISFVPSAIVHEQYERLWLKLMEYIETNLKNNF